ncbi:MAG: ZIP family metal transporter [Candidatus Paceibacterota bacterium]
MMTVIFWSLGAALAVIAVSLIGVLFTWQSLGRWLEKNLIYLVSFSAGVFLFVSYHLFNEAREISANGLTPVLFLFVGLIAFFIFDYLIPESHHHHTEDDCQDKHTPIDARKMLIGDGIHNIGDGIIIAPAFMISIEIGLITTISILIHEALQEISEFFVLRQAGYTTTQALIRNFLISLTILPGLMVGLFLTTTETILPILLAIAAGAFIYVVVADLLPAVMHYRRKLKTFIILLILFATGLGLSIGLEKIADSFGLGHGHDESGHHDDHDDDHLDDDDNHLITDKHNDEHSAEDYY